MCPVASQREIKTPLDLDRRATRLPESRGQGSRSLCTGAPSGSHTESNRNVTVGPHSADAPQKHCLLFCILLPHVAPPRPPAAPGTPPAPQTAPRTRPQCQRRVRVTGFSRQRHGRQRGRQQPCGASHTCGAPLPDRGEPAETLGSESPRGRCFVQPQKRAPRQLGDDREDGRPELLGGLGRTSGRCLGGDRGRLVKTTEVAGVQKTGGFGAQWSLESSARRRGEGRRGASSQQLRGPRSLPKNGKQEQRGG